MFIIIIHLKPVKMKNLKLLVLFGTLFLLTSMVSCQDIDEVLENHSEAIGQEKLNKVQTIIIKGKTLMRENERPFTTYVKRPNKFRTETSMMEREIIRGFDGENNWTYSPGGQPSGREGMGGGRMGRPGGQRSGQMGDHEYFGSQLYNWKEKGHKLEFAETTTMEGTDVYKLKLTNSGGDITYYFLDAESFMILKQTRTMQRMDMEFESETYFSNYKMIDGVAIAFSRETKVNGRTMMHQTIESIEFDKEIDDSMFKEPEKE